MGYDDPSLWKEEVDKVIIVYRRNWKRGGDKVVADYGKSWKGEGNKIVVVYGRNSEKILKDCLRKIGMLARSWKGKSNHSWLQTRLMNLQVY